MRSRMIVSCRKFSPTNSSRLRPSSSLRRGISAVCGIGRPERVLEQRGHREPVRDRADHGRLGAGVHEAQEAVLVAGWRGRRRRRTAAARPRACASGAAPRRRCSSSSGVGGDDRRRSSGPNLPGGAGRFLLCARPARRTRRAPGSRDTTSSARSTPKWLPRKPSSGGPAEERRVADRRDHADPRGRLGRVVGGGAHARPGTRARRRCPTARCPSTTSTGSWPRTTSSTPTAATRHAAPEHRQPTERVEQHRADDPAGRHRRDEQRERGRAEPGGCAVPVDHRDAQPVVGDALGQRHRQHHHADHEGARLGPGLQRVARRGVARRAARRPGSRAREAPPSTSTSTRDHPDVPRRCRGRRR